MVGASGPVRKQIVDSREVKAQLAGLLGLEPAVS